MLVAPYNVDYRCATSSINKSLDTDRKLTLSSASFLILYFCLLMDARAAVSHRIPAELDIIGIKIPASSWCWLLQDSIAAGIVQK